MWLSPKGENTVSREARNPQHFYWPPILNRAFNMRVRLSEMFVHVFFEKSIFKIPLSTIHKIEHWAHWSLKFQKFYGERLTLTIPLRPFPDPYPLFMGLRPRFGLRPIWTPNFWSVVAPLTSPDVHPTFFANDLKLFTDKISIFSEFLPTMCIHRFSKIPWANYSCGLNCGSSPSLYLIDEMFYSFYFQFYIS